MANDTNQSNPDPDADGVHRLHDIVVEEVSLVDRAANKRRFLLVKRNHNTGKTKAPKDRGAPPKVRRPPPWAKKETEMKNADDEQEKSRRRPTTGEADAEKARPEDDDENEDETQKATRREGDEEEEEEQEEEEEDDTEKADDDEEDEDEDEDEDGDQAEKADEASDDDDEEDDEGRDEEDDDEEDAAQRPAAARGAVKAARATPVPTARSKAAAQRGLLKALERLMDVTKRVHAAGPPNSAARSSTLGEVGAELASIRELLDGVAERLPASDAHVAKGGARMARNRLDRFQKALALLSEVLKELTEAKNASPRHPVKPTAKRDADPALRELASSLGELTRVVKHQEESLAAIRKTRGTSNAIAVDGSERRRAPQDVSWPLDMNRPISRDAVGKTVSFYDA